MPALPREALTLLPPQRHSRSTVIPLKPRESLRKPQRLSLDFGDRCFPYQKCSGDGINPCSNCIKKNESESTKGEGSEKYVKRRIRDLTRIGAYDPAEPNSRYHGVPPLLLCVNGHGNHSVRARLNLALSS